MRGLTGCLSFDKGSFQGLNSRISRDSRVHAFLIHQATCTSAASFSRNSKNKARPWSGWQPNSAATAPTSITCSTNTASTPSCSAASASSCTTTFSASTKKTSIQDWPKKIKRNQNRCHGKIHLATPILQETVHFWGLVYTLIPSVTFSSICATTNLL